MTAREVDEWIGKHPSTPIPLRVKVRIVDRQNVKCLECTRRFGPKLKPEFDHRPALINGGQNRESKIIALCEECHDKHFADDMAEKSSVYRKRVKHLGLDDGEDSRWPKRGFGRKSVRREA